MPDRYVIQYDAEGLIDGKSFDAAYSVIDGETGEVFCACRLVGRGILAEFDAESRAKIVRDLLNGMAMNQDSQ